MSNNHRSLGIVTVLAVGIALRLGPLYRSPLPFNPDGVIYAGVARDTLATNTLPVADLAVDALAFTSFLSTVAEVTGATPLSIAQPAIAVVGTIPAVLATVLTIRLAKSRGFAPRHQTIAGVLAGLLLATEGLYLHRSMPVDEQTIGLLLVPLGVYAVVRASSQPRYWWVALPSLAILPVLHNLDTVIAGLALLLVAALALTRDTPDRGITVLGVAIVFTGYAVGLTVLIAELTPAVIVQQARLTRVPGLFLAWTILLTIGVLGLRIMRPRRQRGVILTVFGLGFLLLAVNAVRPIFPGLPTTPTTMVVLLAPLVLFPVVATIPFPWVSEHRIDGRVVLALVGTVLVLVGVSMTAALTAPYLNTVYRAQTFVHLPILVLAALGVTTLLTTSRLRPHRGRQAVVVAIIIVAAVASVPVAYAGLELLPYKGTTTPAELAASGFTSHHVPEMWASDDHLNRITTYYRPTPRFRTNPHAAVTAVAVWLTHQGPPPPCPTLAQSSWRTTGAQLYPRSPATITAHSFDEWTTTNHVVYTASGPDPIYLVIPQTATGMGCDT